MNSKFFHEIEAEAKRLGFLSVGVSTAAPVEEEWCKQYQQWISKGYHAGMQYLEKNLEKRFNPLLLMPEVKTILSVTFPFSKPQKNIPFIAEYAQGIDYHLLIKERLQQLLSFIGCKGRIFVDTAPIMERYWAVKAGLGIIGRNGLLRVPQYGSRIFLGEIFLTVEVKNQSAKPEIQACPQNCRKCIDVCPHKALQEDGTLNANECLSYLTIEHKGELPEWCRKSLHLCFYGCDTCSLVCPMNNICENAEIKVDVDNMQRRSFWEHLQAEDYRKIFKDSAVKRAKYEGLMRNIQFGAEE